VEGLRDVPLLEKKWGKLENPGDPDQEVGRLEKIPRASEDFAGQVLALVRNTCFSEAIRDLNRQPFDLLHRSYPKSECAARYTTLMCLCIDPACDFLASCDHALRRTQIAPIIFIGSEGDDLFFPLSQVKIGIDN
jgi:hypothetical protein